MRFAKKDNHLGHQLTQSGFQLTTDMSGSKKHIDSHWVCAVSGKWFLLTDMAKNHGGHWPTSIILPADGRKHQNCVQIDSHPPPDTRKHLQFLQTVRKKAFLVWIKTEHSSKHQIWKKAGYSHLPPVPALPRHDEGGLMLVGVLWRLSQGDWSRWRESRIQQRSYWKPVQRLC